MSEYIINLDDELGMALGVACAAAGFAREKITRCRDCKRYRPKEGEMFSCRFEYNGLVQWRSAEPDGFCKWGEPRGEGE